MKKRNFAVVALVIVMLLSICACGSPKQSETKNNDTTPVTTDSQSIGLTGVGNARELGGYTTTDGKTVKRGLLLRSAALSNATEDDIKRLGEVFHLSKVIDLRMNRETEAQPDPEIPGARNIHLGIIDEQLIAERAAALDSSELAGIDPDDKIGKLKLAMKLGILGEQMYVNFLSGNQGKENYKKMFEELLSTPEGESLLFHCTQGKDRTGCAAMLILSALGVDEDTILEDFMLTNTYNSKLIESERKMLIENGYEGEELQTLMIAMDEVDSEYMQIALDWLKETYGSVKGYITKELGITDEQIKALKNKYLE